MVKAGAVFLKILRVLIGLILLAYSLCLLGSFFSGFLRDYLAALGQQYKIVEFLFAGIFSTEAYGIYQPNIILGSKVALLLGLKRQLIRLLRPLKMPVLAA